MVIFVLRYKHEIEELSVLFLVKDLCDEIEQCDQLVALRLEGNTINEEAATAIGIALEKHPEIEVRSENADGFYSTCCFLAFNLERSIHHTAEDRSATLSSRFHSITV